MENKEDKDSQEMAKKWQEAEDRNTDELIKELDRLSDSKGKNENSNIYKNINKGSNTRKSN